MNVTSTQDFAIQEHELVLGLIWPCSFNITFLIDTYFTTLYTENSTRQVRGMHRTTFLDSTITCSKL